MTIDREAMLAKATWFYRCPSTGEYSGEYCTVRPHDDGNMVPMVSVDAALSALDQPAQEPVAWMVTFTNGRKVVLTQPDPKDWDSVTPLYAAPQPATEDPLRKIVFRYIDRMNDVAPECGDPAERIVSEFARDVNAVLRSECPQPATLPDESR